MHARLGEGLVPHIPHKRSVCLEIARSRDLGVFASCNHDYTVENLERLGSVCFESLNTAQERYKP